MVPWADMGVQAQPAGCYQHVPPGRSAVSRRAGLNRAPDGGELIAEYVMYGGSALGAAA